MNKKKVAGFVFLCVGLVCLLAYLYFVIKTSLSGVIMTLLIFSILCNVIAVNLFYLSKPRKREKEYDND